MAFSGKSPMADEVIAILEKPPGILRRKSVAEKVVSAITRIVTIFDDGIGDIESHDEDAEG